LGTLATGGARRAVFDGRVGAAKDRVGFAREAGALSAPGRTRAPLREPVARSPPGARSEGLAFGDADRAGGDTAGRPAPPEGLTVGDAALPPAAGRDDGTRPLGTGRAAVAVPRPVTGRFASAGL
ncbi:MAG: hypothetical protein O2992_15940, partial [Gemmatimonadetes bacterium]|nr:hypothetical protein [Gemmatimonadota bacterium]